MRYTRLTRKIYESLKRNEREADEEPKEDTKEDPKDLSQGNEEDDPSFSGQQ